MNGDPGVDSLKNAIVELAFADTFTRFMTPIVSDTGRDSPIAIAVDGCGFTGA
jgi:hypothetical protein